MRGAARRGLPGAFARNLEEASVGPARGDTKVDSLAAAGASAGVGRRCAIAIDPHVCAGAHEVNAEPRLRGTITGQTSIWLVCDIEGHVRIIGQVVGVTVIGGGGMT